MRLILTVPLLSRVDIFFLKNVTREGKRKWGKYSKCWVLRTFGCAKDAAKHARVCGVNKRRSDSWPTASDPDYRTLKNCWEPAAAPWYPWLGKTAGLHRHGFSTVFGGQWYKNLCTVVQCSESDPGDEKQDWTQSGRYILLKSRHYYSTNKCHKCEFPFYLLPYSLLKGDHSSSHVLISDVVNIHSARSTTTLCRTLLCSEHITAHHLGLCFEEVKIKTRVKDSRYRVNSKMKIDLHIGHKNIFAAK